MEDWRGKLWAYLMRGVVGTGEGLLVLREGHLGDEEPKALKTK